MSPRSPLGELEVELTRLLRRARTGQRRTAADVHPDLDSAGYAVLVAVRELAAAGGGARGGEVSEVLGLHKSTTSRNLSTLEDLGLIERVLDPDDARARQVRLTTKGEAALDGAFEARRERLRTQLRSWDKPDIAELARLLRRLNDTPLP
ncbi:MarR family winged helix-turn-helix transcriptional regulator [Nostocoides sp. HKS02]|uniref:MarR family winged helix-turn-helix transcriptional regulator n=1 Tax=Nostocoides sp. HKS02 TaxID=1813880 RepID=UPI0012B4F4F3|nr:MarR family transcriptional regulator [Tetrasphaera sp. HKS02]QGN58499.1 winged helix DNA-binding protein [Tetrasphaera sp. HKS02]